MVTGALNVFVNAVRHEVGLSYYVPKKLTLQDMGKSLEELAEKQKN